MENLKNMNVVELNDDELVQINGGNIWKWGRLIYDALRIQEAINRFADGWNSVECGCPSNKTMK